MHPKLHLASSSFTHRPFPSICLLLVAASWLQAGTPFAYVTEINSSGGRGRLWLEENGKTQAVAPDQLPLQLAPEAMVRVTDDAVAKIVFSDRQSLAFDSSEARSLSALSGAQPAAVDPIFMALNHFDQEATNTRSDECTFAYPLENCTVRASDFVVRLRADWPPGPVALTLSDLTGQKLGETTLARADNALVLSSSELSGIMAKVAAPKVKLSAKSGGRDASVTFILLSAERAARLTKKLLDSDKEPHPVFRHLRRAKIYEDAMMWGEAHAELLAARAAGPAQAARLDAFVAAFVKKYAL